MEPTTNEPTVQTQHQQRHQRTVVIEDLEAVRASYLTWAADAWNLTPRGTERLLADTVMSEQALRRVKGEKGKGDDRGKGKKGKSKGMNGMSDGKSDGKKGKGKGKSDDRGKGMKGDVQQLSSCSRAGAAVAAVAASWSLQSSAAEQVQQLEPVSMTWSAAANAFL